MSTQVTPLQNLLESEDMHLFVENNQDLINELNEGAIEFNNTLIEFVHNNPEVFVDQSVTNISKNIRLWVNYRRSTHIKKTTLSIQSG